MSAMKFAFAATALSLASPAFAATAGVNMGVGADVTSNCVNYGLYTNASRMIPWDSAVGGVTSGSGGTTAALTVYGRIPAQQIVPAGSYSDTLTVTMTF
jgi:spore coat protein U-like protein